MRLCVICLLCVLLLVTEIVGGNGQTVDDEISNPGAGAPEQQSQDKSDILYRVIKADEGGWKASDVGAPFEDGAQVYCHKDISRCASSGVDFLSNEMTILCNVEDSDSTLIRVKCEGEDKSRLMLDECCEIATLEDTSVYATPKGLIHYATWGSTEPVTIIVGMKMVEERYEKELLRRYNGVPLPFMYFADWDYNSKKDKYDIDSNIPTRVQQSTLYQPPFYRTLLKEQTDVVSDKVSLAERIKDLRMNFLGGPFLNSWFTMREALESVPDPSAHFFVKSIHADYGSGVHVTNRKTLRILYEQNANLIGAQVVVEEAVPDLLQISGNQIDIKFYFLIHAGRAYMHQNAEVVLSSRNVLVNGTASPPRKKLSKECLHSFVTVKSSEKEKQWTEAILAQIVASLPVMEPVIRATAEDSDGKLFHIFAGKAMIRENGQALIVSFTEWPIVDWEDTHYNSTECDESTSTMSPKARKILYEEALSVMYCDFFSIVLGLANTTSITDDSESSFILSGRVREAIGFRIPTAEKNIV